MKKRDVAIDIIRGIAIFTMVAANMVPYTLRPGYPAWFRFYGTFAAPIFICLAGMMVALTSRTKSRGFIYYLNRCVSILIVAALIDTLLWKIYPFMTVDVLYLTGLAIPLCYLLGKLPRVAQWAMTASIFLVAPLLQKGMGYREALDTFAFSRGFSLAHVLHHAQPLHSFLIDGWFPLFPWLGVAFFGFLLGEIRIQRPDFANRTTAAFAAVSLALGVIGWNFKPVERITREGYSELFYPPTLSFFCVAISVILLLFFLVDKTRSSKIYAPLKIYGSCSLLMYITHITIICLVFAPMHRLFAFHHYYLIYLGMMVLLLGVAAGAGKLKGKKLPKPVKFVIGG